MNPHHPAAQGAAPAALAARGAMLVPLLQSTRAETPARQFDLWCATTGGLLDHLAGPAVRAQGFLGEAATWRFGPFALTRIEMSRGRADRTARQVRRDGLDHWALTVPLSGRRLMRFGQSEEQLARPGGVQMTALGRPFETRRTHSAALHLYLPRAAMAGLAPALDAAVARPPAGAAAALLDDYIRHLAAMLPGLAQDQALPLAEATRAVVAAAFAPAGPGAADDDPAFEAPLLARVRRVIAAQIGSATFGPDRLCRLVGVSRSRLYRLLEPQGGIAACIQAARLDAARQALADPADARSIAGIAAAVGLFDPSSFSRMFRRAFGCSPREARLAGMAASRGLARPPRAAPPRSIAELLHQL
jgi:AraC-like DNA-binding protein